jgi:hypothetical protein
MPAILVPCRERAVVYFSTASGYESPVTFAGKIFQYHTADSKFGSNILFRAPAPPLSCLLLGNQRQESPVHRAVLQVPETVGTVDIIPSYSPRFPQEYTDGRPGDLLRNTAGV